MLSFATLLTFAAAALAAPTSSHGKLRTAAEKAAPGRYIVKLKDGADKGASIASVSGLAGIAEVGSEVTANIVNDKWTIVNAYVAELSDKALELVLADPSVDFVEEDGIIRINFDVNDVELEARSPEPEPIVETRHFDKRQTGAGVDVYGVDTGIYVQHSSFGGRARWGAVFGGYAQQDGNGHGTHTAGTVGGSGYGPATSASLIAVKVLSDSGSGSFSDVISGIDWSSSQARSSGRPSLINLSLGGGASSAVDAAVTGALNNGVHVVVAAGNDNANAQNYSPARVTAAYTIGAIDSSNRKASFSNFGAVLDVWYLGVNVRSAYIGSTTASASLSGTSMSTPGVVGLLAVQISKNGNRTPAQLQADLKSHAQAVVTGQPSGTTNLKATQW